MLVFDPDKRITGTIVVNLRFLWSTARSNYIGYTTSRRFYFLNDKHIHIDLHPISITDFNFCIGVNKDIYVWSNYSEGIWYGLCAVEEALAHPYLATLHDINDEPVCAHPFEFDFDQPSFSEEHIKELILMEAVAFNPVQEMMQIAIWDDTESGVFILKMQRFIPIWYSLLLSIFHHLKTMSFAVERRF